MTMRFGSIIIHKPDPNSDGNHSSSDDTEVAEIAETAVQKYTIRSKKSVNHQHYRLRSERQRRLMSKQESQRKMGSRRSSSSSTSSKELPILRGLTSDKSPPLNRSHYILPATAALLDDRLHETVKPSRTKSNDSRDSSASPVARRSNSVHDEDLSKNERVLGFRVLTSGSRTVDIHQRRGSTVSADAKLNNHDHRLYNYPSAKNISDNLISTPETIFHENEEGSLTGLSKLLKNLNFKEKLRQQKTEQERLNVHKLPTHMKEQLKHIYVY